MSLGELTLILVIIALGWQFWRIRAMTEQAYRYMDNYCNKQGLQLLSLSRYKTRIRPYRGKLDWYCEFNFEFSGNGEDAYQGSLVMQGMQVTETNLPPYRV
ncbi:DUF3301 domain-containing protein [Bowmanella sp. Y26]|uniref:DUF3301 domain-containing protein n=1 Tax=Bowmanella yangjiangensis TaxID=2811230 RepID=A0ABS3CWB6_9ALTE|nr:DUF3301 domain-containing protein [Bowmanella yangjiangensis]MBN7821419.1 DUF3301 domain-containing protein [Bowmanella yangjiangensis]MBT1065721.1 DUF3301 domain-containing protein [Bowmanella yangjiangensis]